MYKSTYVFSILLIAFIFLFSITASAQDVEVKPKITKETVRLLDDIAKRAVQRYTVKHTNLLLKMGDNIEDFIPLIRKYYIQEQRNILLEILRSKDLVYPLEAMVLRGRLANGELKEAHLIRAIQSNNRVSDKPLCSKASINNQGRTLIILAYKIDGQDDSQNIKICIDTDGSSLCTAFNGEQVLIK